MTSNQGCAIADYKLEMLWQLRTNPLALILGNLLTGHVDEVWSSTHKPRSYSQIFDLTTNNWRMVNTKLVLTTAHRDKANELHLVVICYNETPTITWNDEFSQRIGLHLHAEFMGMYNNLRQEGLEIKPVTPEPVVLIKQFATVPLEVAVKEDTVIVDKELPVSQQVSDLLDTIRQYIVPDTMFDRIRTKAYLVLGVILLSSFAYFLHGKRD